MRTFILGVIVGILLTTIGVHAAGNERFGTKNPRQLLNDEREQARMQGRKKPC